MEIKIPKKLIEVALPLDSISVGCQEEKNPFLKGHPRSVHLWWARRPLAAARAVLFAQLVNDPGFEQGAGFKRGLNKEKAAQERERLFGIIRDLVRWENINNEKVLARAREEIKKSWLETCTLNKNHPEASKLFNPDKLPLFHDPFAGGGAIPLEAQRLGLDTYASDLNPVAVTINKAMIEIPYKFANCAPVGPANHKDPEIFLQEKWIGAKGLAEDVRRYGAWLRQEAEKRAGRFYPKIEITEKMSKERPDLKPYVGQQLTVIAWLWARTVNSPNPAYSEVKIPLVSTYLLSSKAGKEAYLDPIIENGSYRFVVRIGKPKDLDTVNLGTTAGKRAAFKCLMSGVPVTYDYIRAEGQAGRMDMKLLAIVADGGRKRIFLPATSEHEKVARETHPGWKPDMALPDNPRDFKTPNYGLKTYSDLFTSRQLTILSMFTELVSEAITKCKADALKAGMKDDDIGIDAGGDGAKAYAESIGVYLASGISQISRYSCTICGWNKNNENVAQAFGRQAIPMVWDFAEAHPLLGSLSVQVTIGWVASAIEDSPVNRPGSSQQEDARNIELSTSLRIFSTDPPYYDNIGYAELSDFFYVWLRRSLKQIFPSLFATISVPKAEELIASTYRHGSKEKAEEFFLEGMTKVMHALGLRSHPAFPVTIYYAFKQSESDGDKVSSTGWETFLEAVLRSGFQISGTWPMRTEKTEGLKGSLNALASCIILVCRKRSASASTISRREFIRELNTVLPEALVDMTCGGEHSPVAPVDLSQAIIGPGMAVFSKYASVLEADGKPMTVRTALQLINRFLAEDDFDHDTQFCLHWFETVGWSEGKFGEADVLARAKGTSVDGVKEAGVISAGGGKVRLLKWNEYPADWNPETDFRLPVWEGLHHLIRALRTGGETAAAGILGKLGTRIEAVRQLAYRLYTLCERNGWAEDARAYNELIATWQAIEAVAPKTTEKQMDLF